MRDKRITWPPRCWATRKRKSYTGGRDGSVRYAGGPWSGAEGICSRLSPAESFIADTVVPPVVLLPDPECEAQASDSLKRGEPVVPPVSVSPTWSLARSPFTSRRLQAVSPHGGPGHSALPPHGGGSGNEQPRVRVGGDFLIHCHVEPHMMQGMAGLVRALQDLDIRSDQIPELEARLGYQLPIDADLPTARDVDPDRSRPGAGTGRWERLPDNDEAGE